jgi:hypothetical protein
MVLADLIGYGSSSAPPTAAERKSDPGIGKFDLKASYFYQSFCAKALDQDQITYECETLMRVLDVPRTSIIEF